MITTMLCPCCDFVLWVTHRDRYESLEEHVSNPNGYSSMKDGYQCPNEDCVANNMGAVWIESGELFNRPPEGVKNYVSNLILKKFCSDGLTSAKNSWDYHYTKGQIALKKGTRNCRILGYRVEVQPTLDRDRNYAPSKWKRKVTVWRKEGDGEIIWTPQIFMYKVRKHIRNKRK